VVAAHRLRTYLLWRRLRLRKKAEKDRVKAMKKRAQGARKALLQSYKMQQEHEMERQMAAVG